MADIQSPTAEIRRGNKKKKKEETGWKYIRSALLHRATINQPIGPNVLSYPVHKKTDRQTDKTEPAATDGGGNYTDTMHLAATCAIVPSQWTIVSYRCVYLIRRQLPGGCWKQAVVHRHT